MSHELRTPFSSFYGLLDLLASTELQPGQREIGKRLRILTTNWRTNWYFFLVQTAKQSCDHLLKVCLVSHDLIFEVPDPVLNNLSNYNLGHQLNFGLQQA